ncbi:carbohydrate porin [Thaumasiovibrio sp. DFM-14]|uniref:carbohydrate porin n=1 Tax=Thaumasiovibrio sp. DFM-14 TaxID=3384792 RepID=UPI0039A10504
MKRKLLQLSIVAVAISAVCSPAMAGDATYVDGLKYSGYGRGAIGATNDRLLSRESEKADNGMNIIQTAGNPYKPTGSLGNRGSQAELHFDYGVNANDMNWVTHVNLFTGAREFNDPGRPASNYLYLDEWWVHGTGVIESNPNAALWMGKRYYGRYEGRLNGFQHVNSDGTGVGIDNWDLGFSKFNIAVVKDGFGKHTNKFCTEWNQSDWSCTSENGWGGSYFTMTSKLHGIDVTDDIKADVFGSYRTYFGSDKDMRAHEGNGVYGLSAKETHPDGYQIGFALKQGQWEGFNEFVVRYGNKMPTSSTQSWLHIPSYQIGGFFQGMQEFGEHYRLEYQWSHESAVYNDNVNTASVNNDLPYDSTTWNQGVLRGTYKWNQRFSTKIELAYDQMDFDVKGGKGDSGTNSSYKMTLAQDIHIGGNYWDRPVIRFFATYGKLDTETTAYSNLSSWRSENSIRFIDSVGQRDATTVGVMFETWW